MGRGGWHGRMRAGLRPCHGVARMTNSWRAFRAWLQKVPQSHLDLYRPAPSLPHSTLVLEEEEEARQREAARIRRGMFTKSFGRKPDKPLWTPEQMEAEARKRRVVTEKAPAGGGRK